MRVNTKPNSETTPKTKFRSTIIKQFRNTAKHSTTNWQTEIETKAAKLNIQKYRIKDEVLM